MKPKTTFTNRIEVNRYDFKVSLLESDPTGFKVDFEVFCVIITIGVYRRKNREI